MDTRSSRSRFPHELAGSKTNSDGKWRTIGCGRRWDVQLDQTWAVGSDTTRRLRVAQSATMDVVDPPRERRLPQKAQPIREASAWKSSCALARPLGRRGGRLPQEGGREVGYSVLLRFVDSSSTTIATSVSSVAKKVAAHLTIGRCRDCLVCDVEEACRTEWRVWSGTV